jgi:uncharacterized membrane protein
MRITRFLGPVLLALGVLVLFEAIRMGDGSFYLVVIVPVITGSSPWLFLGALLLIVGIFFLPLTFVGEESPRLSPAGPSAVAPGPVGPGASGGVIFVGPFPIFFGAWREHPPIRYRWALLLGVVLAALAVVLFLVAFRP